MPSSRTIAAAAVLLSSSLGVQAQYGVQEFWVAANKISTFIPGGPSDEGNPHYVFPFEWECGHLNSRGMVNGRSDVSGDKKGVRVVYSNPDESNWGARIWVEAEMNNHDGWHLTWRESDFHRLKDLNDKVVGGCEYDRSKSMECDVTLGKVQYDSFLHCVFIGVS